MNFNLSDYLDIKSNHFNLLTRRKIFFCLCLVVFLAIILQVWVMNRLATLGEEIYKIEMTKSSLVLENQILENKLAERSSLQEIKKYANNLGFKPINSVSHITLTEIAANH